jgi:hypothetical protein
VRAAYFLLDRLLLIATIFLMVCILQSLIDNNHGNAVLLMDWLARVGGMWVSLAVFQAFSSISSDRRDR